MAENADPRVIEQDLRKGEVEIAKLRAEVLAAELGALPTFPDSIPAGSLDTGDAGSPVGVAAAYRALEEVAAEIAKAVPRDATSVWIVPSDVVTPAKAVFHAVDATLERLESELATAQQVLTPPKALLPLPLVALSLASSMVKPIASLLATDTKIRALNVTMPFVAVAASVARALNNRNGNGQEQVRILVAGAPAPISSALDDRLRAVERTRDDLATKLAVYRRTQVDQPSARLVVSETKLEAVKQLVAECAKDKDPEKARLDLLDEPAAAVAEARATIAAAAAIVTQVSAVVDDVTTVLAALTTAQAAGASPIHIASLYDAGKEAHVLVLHPTFAGAESIYEDVKMQKDRGLHFGTAIVSFVLTHKDGTLVAAGNVADSVAATTTIGKTEITWPSPRDRAAPA